MKKFDQNAIAILKSEDKMLDALQAVSHEIEMSIPVRPSKPIHCRAPIPKVKGMKQNKVKPAYHTYRTARRRMSRTTREAKASKQTC